MDKLLLALSTLCFLGGFIYAVAALRSGRPRHTTRLNIVFVAAGFLLQSYALHLRGQLHGRCPVTNGAEILIFLCWSVVLLYFVVGRTFRLSLLGMFTEPLVFVFQGIALILLWTSESGAHPIEKVDPWRELHIAVALLSFGAFALAGIAGVMYLVQDRQLKRHQLGALFYNLPPIRYLVDAIVRLGGIGLALLTVGIVSAFLMEKRPEPLHLGMAFAVWLGYAVLLGWHFSSASTPRRFAIASIVVFLLPLTQLATL
ncbi:MAG: cytochrome c biogenesis protein CcsA [Verrucomicrobiae bacterium]|nr:cytochrome c biogenesis protein CcsA [Verrucomicrobiae bacterium]MCB1089172.1 cytochrome c biogenesis protein CcsA [Verrucomicrobiae bacterium]